MNQPRPLGLCDPNLINQAIQRAGAVVPALPVVLPATPGVLAISAADRYRLVKAAKSPTKEDDVAFAAKRQFFLDRQSGAMARHEHTQKTGEILGYQPPTEIDHQRENVAHGTPGATCIIERRKWANEYRVRTEVETTAGNEPPENSGPRITVDLSDRAIRAMADSAAYVAAVRGGYTTFTTLTFNDEQRAKLAAGETSIQRELSRCMDSWQKMYQRGMKREGIEGNGSAKIVRGKFSGLGRSGHSFKGVKAAGPWSSIDIKRDGKLDYLWVVEVPKNKDGEDNPHCHLLMRWRVPGNQFRAWAGRLEKAWGQGFAHIEKIKKGGSAGAYIAKAAGYLCKAQGKSDQGEVRGNRYGISESARAPGWETLTKTQIDCMSQLIADIYDHLSVKHGPDYRERSKLNRSRQSLLEKGKADRAKTGKKTAADWITRQRKKIESRLKKVRATLDALPVRCNQYQIILKGDDAFAEFMAWSSAPKHSEKIPYWLPVKPEGVVFNPGTYPKARQRRYFHELREKFRLSKIKRQMITDELSGAIVDQYLDFRNAALSMWQQYQWCAGVGSE